MEHKSKICGENLRNQDVLNEDRISELPEDLLMQILSSLATKDVIATSGLGKRWRSLWKKVPSIKFDSGYHLTEPIRFSEIVCNSLLYNSPVLDSFYLVDIYVVSEASEDIIIWIGLALARYVRKLVLKLFLDDDKYDGNVIRFPSFFCNWNNTLDTLEISKFFLLDFPSRVGLKSLKRLHLSNVKFSDEESVCNLLCGCPILEDLVLHRRGNCDAKTFTIAVPSLQRLTIVDTFRGTCPGGYVITAPSLKYLNIKRLGLFCFLPHRTQPIESYGFCLIENAPELVEAKITGFANTNVQNENILVSLTSAKRLSFDFSAFKIKCPTGITFSQLVSLELNTSKIEWSNLLARMLDSSPKLQILKLIHDAYLYDDNKVSAFPLAGEWEQRPKCVPDCLLFHLETLVWTGYIWDRKDDREVATYILKNARRLKKATFYTEPIQLEYFQTLEEKHEMLNELASVVRASSSCHLVFEPSN